MPHFFKGNIHQMHALSQCARRRNLRLASQSSHIHTSPTELYDKQNTKIINKCSTITRNFQRQLYFRHGAVLLLLLLTVEFTNAQPLHVIHEFSPGDLELLERRVERGADFRPLQFGKRDSTFRPLQFGKKNDFRPLQFGKRALQLNELNMEKKFYSLRKNNAVDAPIDNNDSHSNNNGNNYDLLTPLYVGEERPPRFGPFAAYGIPGAYGHRQRF